MLNVIVSLVLGLVVKFILFFVILFTGNRELKKLLYYVIVTPVIFTDIINKKESVRGIYSPANDSRSFGVAVVTYRNFKFNTVVHELVHAKQFRVGNGSSLRGVNFALIEEELKDAESKGKTGSYWSPQEIEARKIQEMLKF